MIPSTRIDGDHDADQPLARRGLGRRLLLGEALALERLLLLLAARHARLGDPPVGSRGRPPALVHERGDLIRQPGRARAAARATSWPRACGRCAARARACRRPRRGGSGRAGARARAPCVSIRARSERGGATRPKKSPCSTAADGAGSRLIQSSPVSVRCDRPRGASRARRLIMRVIGAPKVRLTSSGVKASAQPSSALSSTGISTTMPREPIRRGGGDLERHVRAERGAADDRLVEPEVVEQRDRPARRRSASSSATCRAAGPSRRARAGRACRRGCPRAASSSASGRCIRRGSSSPGSSTRCRDPDPYSS